MADIVKDEILDKQSTELGAKISAMPVPETNIGIDTENQFLYDLVEAGEASAIDITSLNNFLQLSQSRETLYQVLDTMAQDSTVSAALEIYAEDATETNDNGDVVWAESSDPMIAKYVTFLLGSLNVNKNAYKWIYSLIKYGDLYLKLFRQSDFDDELLEDKQKTKLNEQFTNLNSTEEPSSLEENVIVKAYDSVDRLVNYVEMIPNPGEMFELTKFGKSYAYLKTNQLPTAVQYDSTNPVMSSYYMYKMRKRDVEVYNAVSFVHAALHDDTPRAPEQVQIFNSDNLTTEDYYAYTVNKGQSILYSSYKIWRQMMLLENALLLNRLTKSSILRLIQVEVGDMPKERVQPQLQKIKSLVEQKASISTNDKMSEYTNPGPMENSVYIPVRNGLGAITAEQLGGDVNIKDIADIDYFKNKFYGSIKIPKMFLGDTDDEAGFNGGTSLSIISSRYAKTVKRIQNTFIQAITDLVNILLIDRGLDSYVNKFDLHMQPPVTQEELDRRDSLSSEMQLINDILTMTADIEDPVIKLKILKSLLSNSISNQEVIELIQDAIDKLEEEIAENGDILPEDDLEGDFDLGGLSGGADSAGGFDFPMGDTEVDFESPENGGEEVGPEGTAADELPTPAELGGGIDFTDM